MLIIVEKVYKCNKLNIVKYPSGDLFNVFVYVFIHKILILL